MKLLRFWKMTVWVAAAALVVSCGSSRNLQKTQEEAAAAAAVAAAQLADSLQKEAYLQKVNDNAQHVRFITSKVKFSVEVGNRQMTLTGNLKMKRDDVIRLQLMAFGFVEAGRLEFTQDYVLIVDRINKQYLKVPYAQLEFFRTSGVDFYMLQALFWNELFQPGKSHLADKHLKKFSAAAGVDNDIIVSMENDKLSYRWLTDQTLARIKMTNVRYADHLRGNYQLNWDYSDFKMNNRKMFPMQHKVTFNTPDKEVKLEMMLNYMGNDEDWETRTTLSGKYRQMPVDDILRRFMSL
ncbi:protein of unknown function [Prevotellaceae bacterium HUN156]|nr:protein of unknown function [Prevotellaceae bacterium HUN156]